MIDSSCSQNYIRGSNGKSMYCGQGKTENGQEKAREACADY